MADLTKFKQEKVLRDNYHTIATALARPTAALSTLTTDLYSKRILNDSDFTNLSCPQQYGHEAANILLQCVKTKITDDPDSMIIFLNALEESTGLENLISKMKVDCGYITPTTCDNTPLKTEGMIL